ncbi:MAG: hypothetical protein EHM79_18710 [Geobacter sp.]|nr:MAG: hypothetical protein EHM79_18710 [Geobacter sp.]
MVEILQDNGIVVSLEDAREDIATYLSTLTHDHFMLQHLMEQTEKNQRSEKVVSVVLDASLSNEDLANSIAELRRMREGTYREIYTPRLESEGAKIPIHYEEMDFGKTRLMQRREKRAEIQVELEGDKVVIRSPASEKGGEIVKDFIAAIESAKKIQISTRKVELSGITSPKLRTQFFTSLIDNLEDFVVTDVKSINIDRELPTLEVEEEDESEKKAQFSGEVRRALLDGSGVIYSPEFKRFTNSGFYICKIEWIAMNTSGVGSKYEFEASLENPAEGTGFKYTVKGKYNQRQSGEFSAGRHGIDDAEKRRLLNLLEKAAWKSLETLAQ